MIVELINRAGSVLDHYQFTGNQIHIGRAYDNDLILHDDYVDGHHLVLSIDEANEGFIFDDLDSTNGTTVVEKKSAPNMPVEAENWLASGRTLCLGKTYLRVKLREHEVPPAQRISFWDNASHTFGSSLVVVVSAIILVLLNVYAQYFDLPRDDKIKEFGFESSYLLIVAFFYAAIWALIARSQKLDGRFLVHVNLCIWFLIADILYGFINPLILFNLGIPGYFSFIETVVGCILIYVLMYSSLFLATRVRKITRNLVAVVVPALMLLFSLSSTYKAPDFSPLPKYDSLIVSPSWNFRSPVSEESFLLDAQDLYKPAKGDDD